MRKTSILLLLAVSFTLSGCIARTEHPLFDGRAAPDEPLLEGAWEIGTKKYLFAADAKGGYRITALDEGSGHQAGDEVRLFLPNSEVMAFTVKDKLGPLHFFKLGEFYFLDSAEKGPVCTARVSFAGADARIAPLNVTWLKEYLRKHPRALAHEFRASRDDETVILKAETKDLQKFLFDHVDELFGRGVPMTRLGKTRAPLYPAKGPASKAQRAFDAWWDARAVAREVPIYGLNSGAEAIENTRWKVNQLGGMIDEPADREILDTLRAVRQFYEAVGAALPAKSRKPEPLVVGLRALLSDPARKLGPGEDKLKPVQEQLRKTLEVADKARAALSKRYDRTFPALTVPPG